MPTERLVQCGTTEWYERLFFNVRDRLDATRWIAQVIAPSNDAMLGDEAALHLKSWFLRWCGYFGGSAVLDMVLGPRRAMSAEGAASEWFAADAPQALKIKAIQTLVNLPLAEKFVLQLAQHAVTPEPSQASNDTTNRLETAFEEIFNEMDVQLAHGPAPDKVAGD
jgi:hypothetical protein